MSVIFQKYSHIDDKVDRDDMGTSGKQLVTRERTESKLKGILVKRKSVVVQTNPKTVIVKVMGRKDSFRNSRLLLSARSYFSLFSLNFRFMPRKQQPKYITDAIIQLKTFPKLSGMISVSARIARYEEQKVKKGVSYLV